MGKAATPILQDLHCIRSDSLEQRGVTQSGGGKNAGVVRTALEASSELLKRLCAPRATARKPIAFCPRLLLIL